jgi:MFS family permease
MVLSIGRTLVHPEETGFAYGMMETASSIAIIAAPILAGILYRADPYAIFRLPIFLILGVIILNLVVFRIIKKKRSQNAAST